MDTTSGHLRRLAPVVQPFGDAAVIVDVGASPGHAATMAVNSLNRHLGRSLAELGWEPAVPGATTLLVPVDPVDPGAAAAAQRVRDLLVTWDPPSAADEPDEKGEIVTIPVRYGGPDGPDLAEVAMRAGLTPAEVIELHTGAVYTVGFSGFAPGFAYLGPLPPRLVMPRRDVPRPRVPAGSVAIAGPQTAVYPADTPGGWWLIGRTNLPVWDPHRDPPALIRPGVRVRFVSR